ncbi:MAG: hypothetical protein JO222_03965 [Frankiales bacterium]|nr:hypothetical protein [Frankiales bacterium]
MSTATDGIDYAHNARARANRVAKATSLAGFIEDLGHLPDEAERREIRRLAGLKRDPSTETWAIAIDIWRERTETTR